MRRIILRIISLVFAVTFLNNCGITKNASTEETSFNQESLLVAYGKEIFKRESCKNCHTLTVESENSKLVSLDGLGGKYSSRWLHDYLFEPQNLIYQSKKKPYKELFIKPLSKEVVSEIGKDKHWNELIYEAHKVEKELRSQGVKTEKTEILALIAYLQHIPASKKKLELDSIENQKYLDKQKKWNEITLDSTSVIIEVAEDDANKAKGKLLYKSYCAACHGVEGQGTVGPNLTDEYWLHGGNTSDIATSIIYGVPEKGMISWKSQLTPVQVGELISFISSIKGTNPNNAKAPQGKKE